MTGFFKSKRGVAILSLILAFVFLGALNAFANRAFRGTSVDFTADRTYTLSEGTLKTLREMEEPIVLRLFISSKLGETVPSYGVYAQRVRSLVERYASLSGGKIRLEIYNPAPFSDDEDRAVAFGLQAIPVDQSGEQVFFGLVGTNTVDETDKIGFFHPAREPFIEYDLTRLVRNLSTVKKKVVGLITALPMQGQFTMQGMQPPWPIYGEITGAFEVKSISSTDKIEGVDVLLIVHPQGMDDQTYYAVEQYLFNGGKAIVMVDPVPETAPRRRSMMGPSPVPPGSNFDKLLKAWGVVIDNDKVATDIVTSIRVNASDQGRQIVANYTGWLQLRGRGEVQVPDSKDPSKRTIESFTNINRSDPTTASLQTVILATPGIVTTAKDAQVKVDPLLMTTKYAQAVEASKFRLEPNVPELLRGYKPGGEVLVLAARLSGKPKTVFAEGPPKKAEEKKDEKKEQTAEEKEKEAKEAAEREKRHKELVDAHLKEAKGEIDMIVIADVDMLSEQFWSREQNFFNETVRVPFTGNADFLMFALDQLSGANAWRGVRGKGQAAKPFERLDALQKASEERLKAKRDELVTRYKEAQEKLKDVRTKGKDGKVELTAEQQKAIQQFTADLLQIRREQRAVQRELREDVEKLDSQLKFYNIGAIPIAVAVIAIFVGYMRYVRRRRRFETA